MAPNISSSVLGIALLLAAVASVNADGSETGHQFTYAGSHGPSHWGSLSPAFAACFSGKLQSPININKNGTALNKSLKPLSRDYTPVNATLINHGYNIGVLFESDCGTLSVGNEKYHLKQMHWHSPSEHLVDGVRYAAELHLVHSSDSGAYAVASILYEYGKPDALIAKLKNKLDELAHENCAGNEEAHIPLGVLDTKLLRKSTRKYYRYIGSLTTPPCTENVTWNILGKVRTISKEQVEALKAPLADDNKHNARPIQLLDGRKVELYNEMD